MRHFAAGVKYCKFSVVTLRSHHTAKVSSYNSGLKKKKEEKSFKINKDILVNVCLDQKATIQPSGLSDFKSCDSSDSGPSADP